MLVSETVAAREAAKPSAKKTWSRAKPLTKVDGRTVAARRIAELRSLFAGALVSAGIEVTPMRSLRVDAAAQAMALAETVRGRFLREGVGDLDEILRAERRADTLIKRLGLPPEKAVAPPDRTAAFFAEIARLNAEKDAVDRLKAMDGPDGPEAPEADDGSHGAPLPREEAFGHAEGDEA